MVIEELMPKNKFDNSHIEELYKLSDKDMEKIIYNLLEWVEDYNFPVAKELIPVLIEREDLVFPYIRNILNSNDYPWQACIINFIIPNFSIDHKEQLKDEILKIINNSKNDEDSEALREIAIECYRKCFDN